MPPDDGARESFRRGRPAEGLTALRDGPRLALSWLTVLPGGSVRVDAASCRWAIVSAPLVGAALGIMAAGIGLGLHLLGCPPLLNGLVLVGLLALATRGMHVDGLADTVDGLGCYGPPGRALAVMRDGGTGPFAVVALVLVLGAQAVCLGVLAGSTRWAMLLVAVACGRAAFTWCCRRGVPAARPDGMGALVAGSQPWPVPAIWGTVLAAAAAFALPRHHWQGVAAVVLAAAVVAAFSWHTRRRLGGVTGDVLGAGSELATTVVLAVAVLRV